MTETILQLIEIKNPPLRLMLVLGKAGVSKQNRKMGCLEKGISFKAQGK